jgi:hypothetical protein
MMVYVYNTGDYWVFGHCPLSSILKNTTFWKLDLFLSSGERHLFNWVYWKDLKVCDDGILIQLLCFWTLSVVLFLLKTHNISETGFSLCLQMELTQLGPIDSVKSWSGNRD